MFKKVALTVSAVAFIMLAIALAPNVPTALATVRATISRRKIEPLGVRTYLRRIRSMVS